MQPLKITDPCRCTPVDWVPGFIFKGKVRCKAACIVYYLSSEKEHVYKSPAERTKRSVC